MFASIISLVIPIGLKILEYFLDKNKADKEMMQRFYEFVEAFDKEYKNSVKLSISYAEQLKKLKEPQVVNPVGGK